MKKVNLNPRVNKNIVLTVLLCLGMAWSVWQILSAAPDPGHLWVEIGDSLNDALTVARGGTGQTSLTAENVLIGNTTGAVKFAAPGTTGNVLASNGSGWTSSALTGLVTLLYSDEADTSVLNTSTTETIMKSWVMNIDPALYRFYIIEADVNANQGHAANANVTFTWNFKVNNTTLIDSVQQRGVGMLAVAGVKTVSSISATSTNSFAFSPPSLEITADPGTSNAAITMAVHGFRVYGVK
jgi:hypothetical protein